MSKVIITWDSNWADEMDISGFSIVSDQEAKELKSSDPSLFALEQTKISIIVTDQNF